MTALAGDRNLSTPARQSPEAAEIVVKTVVTHTVTYFVAGVLAYSLLDYPRLISETTLGVLMRPMRDPMIVAGPLFQPIRGLLFGIMFYLLRQTFFGRRDGWLLMWAVLVVFGIVGPFGAPPGSLEGLIYTTVPVSVQLTFLPEVVAQSLALSWLLVSWVNRPERKWLTWVMGVAFAITLLLPALGLLAGTLAAQVSSPQPPTAGRVEPRTYDSAVFHSTRRMLIYTPPGERRAQAPQWLLICLWGHDYVSEMGAPAAIDTLIHDGRIPPLTAVFLDDPDDRFQSFDTTKAIAASVADEVIPLLRQSGMATDARHTIVAGYSAAGLAATYAAFARPEVFGNVLAQSGAFWRGFDGGGGSEPEWLASQFNAVAARDTRFYIEVGELETVRPGGGSVTFKDANAHLRDVLIRKGYDVTFKEVPNARHEPGHWKAAFPDGLIALTSGGAARLNPKR